MSDETAVFDIVKSTDTKPKGSEHDELSALLDARRFDLENAPAKPVPVLNIGDKVIATAGNLVAVTAQAKAGKTALLTAMVASLMEPRGDCLGITGANPNGLPVVYLDTEQSRFDHHHIMLQVLQRAGRKQLPEWLRESYSLADVSTECRRKALAYVMSHAAVGGMLRAVFVDGVADLCLDPNDQAEAIALVAELHRLAITFDCPIICVIHENPGSDGKTRGHLGSQLERKAETNLRLMKDTEGVTTVFTERSRHCHIPKVSGPRYAWDETAGLHVSCDTAKNEKAKADDFQYQEVVAEIFASKPSLHYNELRAEVMRIKDVKKCAAEKTIQKLVSRFIKKTAGGLYEKA